MKHFILWFFIFIVILHSQQHARYHLQTNSKEALYQLESDFKILKYEPHFEIDYIGKISDKELLLRLGFKILNMTLSQPFHKIHSHDIPDGYSTPEELMKKFSELAKTSKIAKLFDLNGKFQTPPGWEGGHIYALKISSRVEMDEDKPNVLLVANHHAREIMTPEIAYDVAFKLVNGYFNDSRIRNIVDKNQIYIIW